MNWSIFSNILKSDKKIHNFFNVIENINPSDVKIQFLSNEIPQRNDYYSKVLKLKGLSPKDLLIQRI
jgi:hypothetical protein